MMRGDPDITNDLAGEELRQLVRRVVYEARLADDCTKPGRALDAPRAVAVRAVAVLRKINALTQRALAVQP